MPDLSQFLAHIVRTLALWSARARQRRQLEELSDHQLLDIGITRDGALAEARRPPWSGTSPQRPARRRSFETVYPPATPAIAPLTGTGALRRPR
jgi:uncharacterized protein YjiS (DUF1127 family)